MEFTQTFNLDSLQIEVNSQNAMQGPDFTKIIFVIEGIPEVKSNQTGQNTGAPKTEKISAGCARLQETKLGK